MVQGRVKVNGEVVSTLGARVDPAADVVEVDGQQVGLPALRWVLFHKPPGSLTTTHDPQGRTTIFDLLPRELERLTYVGRLDQDTEGLLLLSNDGDAIHRLLHPSFEVEREYEAGVQGVPEGATLRTLEAGVRLEDGPARVAEAALLAREDGGGVIRLVLLEGRKREVRRLCEAVGHPVRWLRRVRFGPVSLGDLPPGAWRDLTSREVAAIRERVGDSQRS